MNITYDPQCGLVIGLPVYEGEMSLKLMRLIIKEVQKNEEDTDELVGVIAAIHLNRVRVQ